MTWSGEKEMGMQIPKPCPKCGQYKLSRSRSKNMIEKCLKMILPMKTYRCHDCRWRGWIGNRKINQKMSFRKAFLFYSAVILISLIIANILRVMILK